MLPKKTKLELLQEKFATKIPGYIHALETLLNAINFKKEPSLKSGLLKLKEQLHQFVGSSGSYGFRQHSNLARNMMDFCDEEMETLSGQSALQRLSIWMDELKKIPISSRHLPTYTSKKTEQARDLIYIYSQHSKEAKDLYNHLNIRLKHIEIFHHQTSLKQALEDKEPAIIVAYVHSIHEAELLQNLFSHRPQNYQSIFVSKNGDFATRYHVVLAGASFFELLPIDFHNLGEKIFSLIEENFKRSPKILILNDDQSQLDYFKLILKEAHFDVLTIDTPEKLLDAFIDFKPELVILDIEMPHYYGPNIGKLIRQYDDNIALPIIYLSASHSIQTIHKAKASGGDDYFVKPVNIDELIDTIHINITRYREIKRLINQDGLTGIQNHKSILSSLSFEMMTAQREATPLSIAEIDLDNFKRVNDTFGHQAGDIILKQLTHFLSIHLRKTDLIGRIGGEEFLIIMHKTEGKKAAKVIDNLP